MPMGSVAHLMPASDVVETLLQAAAGYEFTDWQSRNISTILVCSVCRLPKSIWFTQSRILIQDSGLDGHLFRSSRAFPYVIKFARKVLLQ